MTSTPAACRVVWVDLTSTDVERAIPSIPGGGRIAVFEDPTGAVFAVFDEGMAQGDGDVR